MGNKNSSATDNFIIHFNKLQPKSDFCDHHLNDHRRIVFISLIGLFNSWKECPAPKLYSSIFILPLKREWVYNQRLLRLRLQQIMNINIQKNCKDISAFKLLLKWKDSQKLLFCMDDDLFSCGQYSSIHSSWSYLSSKLSKLFDPVNKCNYNPIKLNKTWWQHKYNKIIPSKYNAKTNDILSELLFVQMKFKSVKEILYQSNPSLNVITSYNNNIYNDDSAYLFKTCNISHAEWYVWDGYSD